MSFEVGDRNIALDAAASLALIAFSQGAVQRMVQVHPETQTRSGLSKLRPSARRRTIDGMINARATTERESQCQVGGNRGSPAQGPYSNKEQTRFRGSVR